MSLSTHCIICSKWSAADTILFRVQSFPRTSSQFRNRYPSCRVRLASYRNRRRMSQQLEYHIFVIIFSSEAMRNKMFLSLSIDFRKYIGNFFQNFYTFILFIYLHRYSRKQNPGSNDHYTRIFSRNKVLPWIRLLRICRYIPPEEIALFKMYHFRLCVWNVNLNFLQNNLGIGN